MIEIERESERKRDGEKIFITTFYTIFDNKMENILELGL